MNPTPRQLEVKSALVAAHRAEDWERAKQLSQEKEKLKKRKRCIVCDVPLARTGNGRERCQMHYIQKRFYSKAIA